MSDEVLARIDQLLQMQQEHHREMAALIEQYRAMAFEADDRGPDRKVAAIGIRVSEGVTRHGLALYCDNDLAWFDRIVPCGITDAGVTSLTAELGRTVTVDEVLPLVERRLLDLYSSTAAVEA